MGRHGYSSSGSESSGEWEEGKGIEHKDAEPVLPSLPLPPLPLPAAVPSLPLPLSLSFAKQPPSQTPSLSQPQLGTGMQTQTGASAALPQAPQTLMLTQTQPQAPQTLTLTQTQSQAPQVVLGAGEAALAVAVSDKAQRKHHRHTHSHTHSHSRSRSRSKSKHRQPRPAQLDPRVMQSLLASVQQRSDAEREMGMQCACFCIVLCCVQKLCYVSSVNGSCGRCVSRPAGSLEAENAVLRTQLAQLAAASAAAQEQVCVCVCKRACCVLSYAPVPVNVCVCVCLWRVPFSRATHTGGRPFGGCGGGV